MSRSERGAATMLVALVATGLVGVTALVIAIAAVFVAGHRARQAADLAALSSAHSYVSGGDACIAAAEVAGANGGALVNCTVTGPRTAFAVSVTVSVPIPLRVPGIPSSLAATSRAGTPAR